MWETLGQTDRLVNTGLLWAFAMLICTLNQWTLPNVPLVNPGKPQQPLDNYQAMHCFVMVLV